MDKISKKKKVIYSIISILIFLGFWQFITTFTVAKETTPPPLEVFQFIINGFKNNIGEYTLLGHILISLRRVLTGFIAGTISGVVIGISMGVNRTTKAILSPFFEVFRQIPPIAWIPLAILWFGIGEFPKYFIIFIGTFVNVTLNSYDAAVNVDEDLIGAAEVLGSSNIDIFFQVILPSCVPEIFNGMQVGLSVSWMGVLAAEMVSSFAGIGWIIIRGSDTGNIAQVLAGMVIIGLIGLSLSAFMRLVERRLTIWNQQGT